MVKTVKMRSRAWCGVVVGVVRGQVVPGVWGTGMPGTTTSLLYYCITALYRHPLHCTGTHCTVPARPCLINGTALSHYWHGLVSLLARPHSCYWHGLIPVTGTASFLLLAWPHLSTGMASS